MQSTARDTEDEQTSTSKSPHLDKSDLNSTMARDTATTGLLQGVNDVSIPNKYMYQTLKTP